MSWLRSLILKGLAVSLIIHLLAFGGWEWGQAHGWWKRHSTPAWMLFLEKLAGVKAPKKLSDKAKSLAQLKKQPQEIPMVFVDTDPALAVNTPPKESKFYGANNTVAANPEKKVESEMPQIKGSQDKVLKTTDPNLSKAQPLQPSPPKPQVAQETPKPQTEPKSETKPVQPEPQKRVTPGDLAFAKPQESPQDGTAEKPRVPAAAQPESAPPHTRPRTLNEARRNAGLSGERAQQTGGVNRLAMSSSLDVTRTVVGDYDREFVDAVQHCWDQLLENSNGAHQAGKVVLEFRLYYNGRISDMRMPVNEVGDMLAAYCQLAVQKPAPYREWPIEMRREIKEDYRDIRFTFYYLSH